SRAVSDAAGAFLEGLKKVAFSKGEIPVFSNTTGKKYPATADAARELLANQLAKPVDFMSMIQNMYADGVRTFVEVGPGAVLKGLVNSILGAKAHVCLGLDSAASKQSGMVAFARVLAHLSAAGYPVDLNRWNLKLKNVESVVASKPKMTVPISGVNHISKKELTPPKPKTPPKKTTPWRQTIPQPEPKTPSATWADDQDTHMIRESTDESMKHLQAGMVALQKLQEETARLHGKFLEGQQAATRMLASLLDKSRPGLTTEAHSWEKIQNTSEPGIVEKPYASPEPGLDLKHSEPERDVLPDNHQTDHQTDTGSSAVQAHILSVLLGAVSETTGYPVEMLELDMTLDNDLGIDSIKRVEIFSILREKMPDAPEIEAKHLGELESLQDIVDHLADVGRRVSDVGCRMSDIFRMVVSCEQMEPATSDTVQISKTGPFWITRDNHGLCVALQGRLRGMGYETVAISFADLDRLDPPDSLAGLMILGAEDTDDRFISNAFELLRIAEKSLRKIREDGIARFVTVTFMDGKFGFGNDSKEMGPTQGGLAGLSKTAGHEWPEVGCLALDIGGFDDREETAAAIVSEIFRAGPMERGLGKDHRITPKLVPRPLQSREKRAVSVLNPDDVVIVSGGARGVTAEVTAAVAQAYGPVIILLGRSPGPEDESRMFSHLETESEIKRAILAGGSGNMTPKALEENFRKVIANREINRNIERLKGFGARVQYHSVDIRNLTEVVGVLDRVRNQFGKITAVIHGAGVLEDRLIGDKTIAQFETVYSTKVEGLRNLFSATEPDNLKMVALFSSSSARFGRKGQIDYSSANEVLNKMAQAQARTRPDCRTVAVNWGPWDGGMVTETLKPLFKEEGIDLIDKKAGAGYFIDEFESNENGPVEVVVMGGPLKGEGIPDSIPKGDSTKTVGPMASSFELDLTIDHYPILQDHVMNGNAVLPAAIMIEWLAQGALRNNPGYRFVGFDDFRVLKGIIMKNGDSQHLKITAGHLSGNNGN
ncbi:MAG: SDR family NAD(P)-dependent oxidoreductase, partial [Deltaproteobacteria bacterium]|nr:SDR family NAD(P)-dependent oxidoreductase [Deltaproteobacteria bacterium]